ncbi:hypothetical protein RD792_014692 [Penstemon davidsonii]|uniref:Signal peptidase complex catalytic subunit SEC11 n=1 Tax=Penstemon davidsonii TaxID=160366 RepID=A0ABR0CRU2_9LAMI|nr:hypothetical protein RD792_014692 [Penstemon davidsonii]
MGKGGELSDGVVKKIILSYTYVAIWIFLSFTVIVYNKYILDRKMYNWPYPISLTLIHMGFCSSVAYLLVRIFKVVEPVTMSWDLYLKSVVPIGLLYSVSLWLSNSAYIYLSVSFIQMLKALMPVAVYSIGILLKKDIFKSDTMANMIAISIGVAIAAYGEAKFDSWGVILQLGAVAFEATRLVMIQILLTSQGITLNPITSLYYVAPCCMVFLFFPWLFVEYPLLKDTSSFHFDYVVFGTNSSCAFALNLAVFLLVGKTSALTMNVAGVVKDWLLIAFSWSVIKDTVTPINLVGYGLAFLGVAYYNHAKLKALKDKEAQKKAQQQTDEESGRLLEERDGGINGGSESPVVVVLSGSMEPGFQRGDILFLHMSKDPIRAGEIVVFNVDGREIPIVHRVIKVHERQETGEVNVLTKGDNNFGDDRPLYAEGQHWLQRHHIMGRAVGFLPYVGWVTIIMTEKPIIKYILIGALGLLVITSKD